LTFSEEAIVNDDAGLLGALATEAGQLTGRPMRRGPEKHI
jgi:hypothetical protein